MNFDMLQAIVQEMNLYEESAKDALKWLNARPEFGSLSQFDVVELVVEEQTIKPISRMRTWYGNPVGTLAIKIDYRKKRPKTPGHGRGGPVMTSMMMGGEDDDGDPVYHDREFIGGSSTSAEFTASMLQTADGSKGVYTYYNAVSMSSLKIQKKSN